MEWFDRAKMMIVKFTDIGIALLALAIILQLLFGNNTQFVGDVAGNIMATGHCREAIVCCITAERL
jgi:hypothetical protein